MTPLTHERERASDATHSRGVASTRLAVQSQISGLKGGTPSAAPEWGAIDLLDLDGLVPFTEDLAQAIRGHCQRRANQCESSGPNRGGRGDQADRRAHACATGLKT